MAALSRMANRDHMIRIGEGDTVLLASSLIPGNENAIYRRHQRASPAGAPTSCTRATRRCTSPGTPAPASSSTATTSCSPRNVMPVHGEWRHLRANARPRDPHRRARRRTSCIAEDGVVVDLVDGQATITGKVPGRATCTSTGMTVGGATEASLKDRRTLAEEGVVTIVGHRRRGHRRARRAAGLPGPRLRPRRRRRSTAVVPLIEKALATAAQEGIGEPHQLEQLIHRDRQPLGPRHLPAQPGHHADHHRRLTAVRQAVARCRARARCGCPIRRVARRVAMRPIRPAAA